MTEKLRYYSTPAIKKKVALFSPELNVNFLAARAFAQIYNAHNELNFRR